MSTLRAVDLTTIQGSDPLWRARRGRGSSPGLEENSTLAEGLGLPARGFASPLGFWFAPEDAWTSPPPYALERVSEPSLAVMGAGAGSTKVKSSASARRVVAIERRRIGGSSGGSRPIGLAVEGATARIDLDERDWPEISQATLLAVATCWRLEALDRELDRLIDDARVLIQKKGRFPRPMGRAMPRGKDLRRDGHSLILDLPDFEGPLTDPGRYLDGRESRRLFRRLCIPLGLTEWRDRIDERAEVLDGILGTLADGGHHRQVVTLEILIILLLTADIALATILGLWE